MPAVDWPMFTMEMISGVWTWPTTVYSVLFRQVSSLKALGFSLTVMVEPTAYCSPTFVSTAISPSRSGMRPSTSSSWETSSGMLITRMASVEPSTVTSLK